MIQIPPRDLPPVAWEALRSYQAVVNAEADFAKRVATASAEFAKRNRDTNPIFREVRATLTRMCSGAQRCMYCEDSAADEVEHFLPKNLYPEYVFDWLNYLYACGPCNGPKNRRFPVLAPDGSIVDPVPKRGDPPLPPVKGDPALLHPRIENPLRFMMLDIHGGTFRFIPVTPKGSRAYQRAYHTIEVLRLNRRDYLLRARREACQNDCARLKEYRQLRDAGEGALGLNLVVKALQRMQHPTVWAEMCRQRDLIPALTPLFASAPEALSW